MLTDVTKSATGVQTASLAEVFARRQQGLPLDLIDVRSPVEYAEVHAEGARLIPLDRLEPETVAAAREATPDKPLFVICKSGSRAMKGVARFHAAGFPNVICIEGGTDAWIQAGLPVVRGARKAISLERQVRIAAGLLVLIGTGLGWFVHPAFLGLSAFVGAGLVFAGITDWCGMGMLLARMPWNSRPDAAITSSGTGDDATSGCNSLNESE
jgi:rhodanese-related sulfurtransferase